MTLSKRPRDSSTDDEPSAKRRRRAPLEQWLAVFEKKFRNVHFDEPRQPAAGGRKVVARLGPRSYFSRANDANPRLPSAIVEARTTYPHCSFKAGHLLNCQLGGPGGNYKNMTILTGSANTKHTKYDNAVVRSVQKLERVYKALYAAMIDEEHISALYVEVSISVNPDSWGKTRPDCFISTGLTISTKLVSDIDLSSIEKDSAVSDVKRLLADLKAEVAEANGTVANTR